MKIESFWNQAFLNALCRLPVKEAMEEASIATAACVKHWEAQSKDEYLPVFIRQSKLSVKKAGKFKIPRYDLKEASPSTSAGRAKVKARSRSR